MIRLLNVCGNVNNPTIRNTDTHTEQTQNEIAAAPSVPVTNCDLLAPPPTGRIQRNLASCTFGSRTAATPEVSYTRQLFNWQFNAPPGERIARNIVVLKILRVICTRSKKLHLEGFGLTTLPELPACIENLYLYNNLLTSLPRLPPRLKSLGASDNRLTSLPELPESLEILSVRYNQLVTLPRLPCQLRHLAVDHNQMTTLPDLPNDISCLQVNDNRLTRLPELPDSLCFLEVQDNSLTTLPRLPPNGSNSVFLLRPNPCCDYLDPIGQRHYNPGRWEYGRVREWQVANPGFTFGDWPPNGIAPLPVMPEPAVAIPAPAVAIPEPIFIPPRTIECSGRNAFMQFLKRLEGKGGHPAPAEYQKSKQAVIARVNKLCDAMSESPELSAICYLIAEESTTSCGDRVTLALNDMEMAHINHDAQNGRYTDAELFALGRGMYRLDALEQIISSTTLMQTASRPDVDPVEIRLAYQTRLASRLELPAVAQFMLHEPSAKLTQDDYDRAEQAVLDEQEKTGGIDFLVNWLPWQEAMKRKNPGAFCQVEKFIEQQQARYSVLPDNLSSQAQMRIYDAVLRAQKNILEEFLRGCTFNFIKENQSNL
jgi:E3 ubiquitin-protein ligase SspH2